MTSSNPAIVMRSLRKTYRRRPWQKPFVALSGLTLDIQPGEGFGFLGANGAGKTTAIRILLGLAPKSGGSASILGMPSGTPKARRRIGYLPENPYFYDFLSGRELLDFYGRLAEVSSRDRKRRIPELLELVGMSEFADRQVRAYSKGMLQRIGLAQALLGDPQVIILDEPTAGLDPLGRREVRDLILDLRDEGKTIFLSSHMLSEIEMICDRVAILRRGELARVGTLHELLTPRGKKIVCSAPVPDLGDRVTVTMEDNRATLLAPPASDTNAILRDLLAAGVTIHEVHDLRESLEDLFVRLEQER